MGEGVEGNKYWTYRAHECCGDQESNNDEKKLGWARRLGKQHSKLMY